MDRIIQFLFEAGQLKRTPRSGWQFLGSGSESVAEHVFRTTIIAWVLVRLEPGVNADRVLQLALMHDLPEARTGDLNYMNQKYVVADELAAATDMADQLPFGDELVGLLAEYRAQETPEAVLARDADHLEFLLQLKEHGDLGNPSVDDWIPPALERLRTPIARDLARRLLAGHSADWWFDRGSDWWVSGGKN